MARAPRFADGSGSSAAEARAAQLFGAARGLDVPPAPGFAGVERRAVAKQKAARLVVLLATIPLAATGAISGWQWARHPERSDEVAKSKDEKRAPPPAPQKPVAIIEPVKVEETPTAVAPPPPVAIPRKPQPPTSPVVAAVVEAPPPSVSDTPEIPARAMATAPSKPLEQPSIGGPPSPSVLALEARALSDALAALRVARDPNMALGLLDGYRTRFPNGALRVEATLAEVEAHRALGHDPLALDSLRRLPNPTPSLRVLEAELLASTQQCDAALEQLRELPASGALRERVLFTTATCEAALHRDGDARSHLLQYLSEFPSGTFAARARTMLEGR